MASSCCARCRSLAGSSAKVSTSITMARPCARLRRTRSREFASCRAHPAHDRDHQLSGPVDGGRLDGVVHRGRRAGPQIGQPVDHQLLGRRAVLAHRSRDVQRAVGFVDLDAEAVVQEVDARSTPRPRSPTPSSSACRARRGPLPVNRAGCWRWDPRPAPRGAPSGRPSGPWSASGSGVRRRLGGTRGPARRPDRPRRSDAGGPHRCCRRRRSSGSSAAAPPAA